MERKIDELYEERRILFSQKYKEAFGIEPKFKPLMSDEDRFDSGEYTLVLNYYGIKSN